jgi:uncharacterized membrane protein YkgB
VTSLHFNRLLPVVFLQDIITSKNMEKLQDIIKTISTLDKAGIRLLRIAIAIILIWIGGLKFFPYEAEGITPFVANSPFMSFFYNDPEAYKAHRNKEGELVTANREWHNTNNTYGFSYGLGTLLVSMGILLLLNGKFPLAGMVGGILVFIMSIGTLSFLVTTPETWVPALGDTEHGFPYLSAAGRLVIKDFIMMGGAVVVTADAARKYLAIRELES